MKPAFVAHGANADGQDVNAVDLPYQIDAFLLMHKAECPVVIHLYCTVHYMCSYPVRIEIRCVVRERGRLRQCRVCVYSAACGVDETRYDG